MAISSFDATGIGVLSQDEQSGMDINIGNAAQRMKDQGPRGAEEEEVHMYSVREAEVGHKSTTSSEQTTAQRHVEEGGAAVSERIAAQKAPPESGGMQLSGVAFCAVFGPQEPAQYIKLCLIQSCLHVNINLQHDHPWIDMQVAAHRLKTVSGGFSKSYSRVPVKRWKGAEQLGGEGEQRGIVKCYMVVSPRKRQRQKAAFRCFLVLPFARQYALKRQRYASRKCISS
ncbi:hypothetical protein C2E23DRAFT_861947 [Lenzites betulinus]|nr:hypothetical protein C2E23DRAFT_861947 [Lenzites betulinus]